MIDRASFFAAVRGRLFRGSMNQMQVDGITAILDYWERNFADFDARWLSYCLATAHHETAATMQPIEEYGKGAGHPYGQRLRINGTPYTHTQTRAYGRGLVQLTWIDNYEKAGATMGADYVNAPELLLTLEHAVPIMFIGMMEGWFTGRKLGDFIRNGTCDYVNARRIINGTDRAELIAGYAVSYEASIRGSMMPSFADVKGGVVT